MTKLDVRASHLMRNSELDTHRCSYPGCERFASRWLVVREINDNGHAENVQWAFCEKHRKTTEIPD